MQTQKHHIGEIWGIGSSGAGDLAGFLVQMWSFLITFPALMNTLTSMLRAVRGFVLGPEGRLSSSYSKTQHLKLVDGASKRSCMLCLVLRPRLRWAFCFHWPFLRLLWMRFLRISYVQTYWGWSAVLSFRGLGLQPDVVDNCLACDWLRMSESQGFCSWGGLGCMQCYGCFLHDKSIF